MSCKIRKVSCIEIYVGWQACHIYMYNALPLYFAVCFVSIDASDNSYTSTGIWGILKEWPIKCNGSIDLWRMCLYSPYNVIHNVTFQIRSKLSDGCYELKGSNMLYVQYNRRTEEFSNPAIVPVRRSSYCLDFNVPNDQQLTIRTHYVIGFRIEKGHSSNGFLFQRSREYSTVVDRIERYKEKFCDFNQRYTGRPYIRPRISKSVTLM